jgi:hypothetical protein
MKALSFHQRGQRSAFRRRGCASTTQIVCPSESMTETQPRLQPALLSLSAMISQYFILMRRCCSYHFVVALCRCLVQNTKAAEFWGVKHWKATLAILAALSASLAVAEDFKTINGKIYKDATISRVEADGLILRTKTGISKVYFIELPKDVQERFHPSPAHPSPAKTVATQRERESVKLKGWAAAMANPIAFIVFLVAGAIIIAGVVFAIVRSRLRSNNDASKV